MANELGVVLSLLIFVAAPILILWLVIYTAVRLALRHDRNERERKG